MRCNVLKLKSARDRRAMTQEKLAAEARVDIRTVQRAEAGDSLRHETIADIAAVLGLPVSGLIEIEDTAATRENDAARYGAGLTLKRAAQGREVIELLEDTRLGKLECDADPSDEIMPILKEAIEFLESMLPNPWDESGLYSPITFSSLVHRLEHIAKMGTILDTLDRHGLALFMGSSWLAAVMPRWRDARLCTHTDQRPESVRATRLLLSHQSGDRVTVVHATKWPVDVIDPPLVDDDDDVPF